MYVDPMLYAAEELANAVMYSLSSCKFNIYCSDCSALFFGGVLSASTIVVYILNLEGLLFINGDFFSNYFGSIDSLDPLWFITIIMLCYLLVPILQTIILSRSQKYNKISFILVLILGSLASVAFFPLTYFFVFIIGYFSGYAKLLDKVTTWVFAFFSISFVILISLRIVLHHFFDNTYLYFAYVKLSHCFVGIYWVFLFAFLYKKIPNLIQKIGSSKVMTILDGYSFYVYLVHGIFCMGAFNVFEKIPLPLATILFLLCTVFSAILLKLITDLLLKQISRLPNASKMINK